MSNLEMINRLTKGVEATEIITVEGVDIEIRPLTSGELSELQRIENKGFVMKLGINPNSRKQKMDMNDIDINAGDFNQCQNEAMYKAVALGLSIGDEKISIAQVQELPPGAPEQIFNEIIRISKITEKDLIIVKNFRKE